MADNITKKDLENILDTKLDTKLEKYQKTIIDAVDYRFRQVDANFQQIDVRFDKIENEITELLKKIIKEKFGVEISAVGW